FDSSTGRYGIRHVVSVDEGLIGIGNDTYTNAIARQNLEFAMLASRGLGRAPTPAGAAWPLGCTSRTIPPATITRPTKEHHRRSVARWCRCSRTRSASP